MNRDELSAEVRAELTGPGGFFEMATEDVRGRPMPVFVHRKRTLRELIESTAPHADAEFLVLGDARYTYAEFLERTASVAAGLAERHGIGKGDRVAILAANRPEWIITFFAATSLGAIVAALNGWWTADEIGHGLELSEPKLLVGDTKRLARVAEGTDGLTVVDMQAPEFAELMAHRAEGLPIVALDEDDPALILFTSGTTGRPKGALISHRGLIGFIDGMIFNGAEKAFMAAKAGGPAPSAERPQLVTLATSPLFHVSGLFGSTLMAVAVGGKLVFREGRFDPADVLRLMEEERITSWSAMGSMGPRLLDCPDIATRDLSSVTNIGFGGAPVAPDLQDRLRAAFPNAAPAFGMGYGSSESVAVITSIGGPDYVERPTSCGEANIGFEIQIRDELGEPLPDGVEGLIHVRSPYTMLGYWRNPQATDEVIDDEGWLNMGDIGRVEDGWLYINSRARDMILRDAENIYPVEIEHRLDDHPQVAENAVVGVDHPEWGQEVKAIVVPVEGAELDADDLAAWCGETLAPFKVPTSWEIRGEPLPRNAAGKVVKGALTGDQAHQVHED